MIISQYILFNLQRLKNYHFSELQLMQKAIPGKRLSLPGGVSYSVFSLSVLNIAEMPLTQCSESCKILLARRTACGLRQSPIFKEGAKNFFKAPLMKGGGRMITYSDFYQLIIAICEVITVYLLIKSSKKK